MKTIDIKRLEEQRGTAVTAMHALVAKAETEDRGLTAEERSTWDAQNTDIESLDSRIADAKLASTNFAEMDEAVRSLPAASGREEERTGEQADQNSYDEVFDKFCRFGSTELNSEERTILRQGAVKLGKEERAQSVGTTTAGGFTVPEGFSGFIEDALLQFSGIRNAATVLPTATGATLPFPTNDDTGNAGALLAENTQDSEQDLTFGEMQLGAYKYTSKIIRVSVELMQDSAFNMDAYIGGKFGERLGRATSAHYATGTGTGQPNGLMTAATIGKTAALNSAITYLEMLDLKHSVDPAYRMSAKWAFNDSTLKALKQLLDADGRPLWSPSIDSDVGATLDGDGYVIDQGIASIGSATLVAAYGDLSKYLIRDVKGFTMVRLAERYADFHQLGFIAFMRSDADLLDAGTNPVKTLKMAV